MFPWNNITSLKRLKPILTFIDALRVVLFILPLLAWIWLTQCRFYLNSCISPNKTIEMLHFGCLGILSLLRARAYFFVLILTYSSVPFVTLTGPFVLLLDALWLVLCLSVIHQFLRDLRNNTLFLAPQLKQNTVLWTSYAMSWNGYIIFCVIFRFLNHFLRPCFVIIRPLFTFLQILFFINAPNILRSIVTSLVMSFKHNKSLPPIFLQKLSLWISSPKLWGNLSFIYSWASWASVIYTL